MREVHVKNRESGTDFDARTTTGSRDRRMVQVMRSNVEEGGTQVNTIGKVPITAQNDNDGTVKFKVYDVDALKSRDLGDASDLASQSETHVLDSMSR